MPGIINKLKYQKEIPAICIFCTLLGICISLFFLRKDLVELGKYVDAFAFQLKSMSITKERILLHIICKRVFHLTIIFILSIYTKNKNLINCFLALFFLIFGIFISSNIIVLGMKGILAGLFLIIPQWIFYFASYYLCIKQFAISGKVNSIKNIILIIILLILIILGGLVETYVTQPVIFKIIS